MKRREGRRNREAAPIRIRGDSHLVGQWKGEGLGARGQEKGGREQRDRADSDKR